MILNRLLIRSSFPPLPISSLPRPSLSHPHPHPSHPPPRPWYAMQKFSHPHPQYPSPQSLTNYIILMNRMLIKEIMITLSLLISTRPQRSWTHIRTLGSSSEAAPAPQSLFQLCCPSQPDPASDRTLEDFSALNFHSGDGFLITANLGILHPTTEWPFSKRSFSCMMQISAALHFTASWSRRKCPHTSRLLHSELQLSLTMK